MSNKVGYKSTFILLWSVVFWRGLRVLNSPFLLLARHQPRLLRRRRHPRLASLLPKRPARRSHLPMVTRRSVARRGRRPTAVTSTKVCQLCWLFNKGTVRVYSCLFSSVSLEASPPWYWYLEQGYGYLELVCQRYLRAYCHWGIKCVSRVSRLIEGCVLIVACRARFLLQEVDYLITRDSNSCQADPSWRTC